MTTTSETGAGFLRRTWIYQNERFPVLKTGILLLAFTAASISVSAHLAGRPLPAWGAFAAAWAAVFLIFFQMRAADETKDFHLDAKWRPERPIHRGLVSLRSVQTAGLVAFPLAAVAVWAWSPAMLLPLAMVWIWLALMTVEFFVPEWLTKHPLVYLVSHMAIMPLIDFLATSAEWLPAGGNAPDGLGAFLLLSFANGVVLEIGRKIWAPGNEREGVETYSGMHGHRRASGIWVCVLATAFVLQCFVAHTLGVLLLSAPIGGLCLIVFAGKAMAFVRSPSDRTQSGIDAAAGMWVLSCYLVLGLTPFAKDLLP
jgi:hypothetical protein